MNKTRGFGALALAVIIGLVVACGGGSDNDASQHSGAANPPQARTGIDVPEANALNVSNVAATLQQVESFRFDFKVNLDIDLGDTGDDDDAALAAMFLSMLGNMEAEGAYVAPDRTSVKMNIFGMELQTITIGDEAWTNDGSGWTAASEEDGFGATFGMPFDFTSPEMPFDFLPDEELSGAKITDEKVNGVDTKHYSFDKDSLQSLAQSLGEEVELGDLTEVDTMSLDLWVTGDGVPVKMVIAVAGQSEGSDLGIDLEFNIKDLNDDSISIERPI